MGALSRTHRGMTLIEIIVVLFIFSILLLIAIPSWMRQREHARSRACQENLTRIDGAKEIYALENNSSQGAVVQMDILVGREQGYIKKEPICPAGGQYLLQPIGTIPSCTYYGQESYKVPPHALPVGR